jgi:two-component system sensor histidine kinase/response regulator
VWRVVVLPIRRLVTATGRLADGDFSVRTDIAGNDELAELAGSFDAMAEKLHASQQALRRANESLEVKVAQRTAELKRANRRLRGEMTEKEEFLRAVSHDLNAPLRNIAGMATMILMKWRDDLPEEVLARLQRIQANIQIETDLLGELLEISRIRSRPQKREWVELGALLAEVRGAFEYELKQRSIALDIDCGMPALHVERNRIRELFQNLIDNAIKYMSPRPDGRIRVGYQLADGMHRFWVADNGPGVAPEERERIFTVFRRAANAAQTGVPGKGVGLAVVRTIVGNYDGRVWVESNSPEGAVFFVELSAGNTRGPVAEADREHSEIPAASAAD